MYIRPVRKFSNFHKNISGFGTSFDLPHILLMCSFIKSQHLMRCCFSTKVHFFLTQWVEEESFQLRVEAPERASTWEHVGVRVTALNKHVEDVTAHITLAHSTDYKFVALEDFDTTMVSTYCLIASQRVYHWAHQLLNSFIFTGKWPSGIYHHLPNERHDVHCFFFCYVWIVI